MREKSTAERGKSYKRSDPQSDATFAIRGATTTPTTTLEWKSIRRNSPMCCRFGCRFISAIRTTHPIASGRRSCGAQLRRFYWVFMCSQQIYQFWNLFFAQNRSLREKARKTHTNRRERVWKWAEVIGLPFSTIKIYLYRGNGADWSVLCHVSYRASFSVRI